MIAITMLRLDRSGTNVRLTMATIGSCGVVVSVACERTVGSIMSAVSCCVKELVWLTGGAVAKPEATDHLVGTMALDTVEIEPLVVDPMAYKLTMVRGPYRYEATSDRNAEMVLLMFQGAMKFFAFKEKLITVEEEITWNRQEASRLGLLTKEDG